MSIVVHEHPPNFAQIVTVFPHAVKPGVIFAYGDHIYIPDGSDLPDALYAHELVHLGRQNEQFTPDQWWDMYLADQQFRYNEELLAHVAEYTAQKAGLDRNGRARLMHVTAARLVAPLYNYLPPRTIVDAARDLRARV